MPIHLRWYVPNHVLLIEMSGIVNEALYKSFMSNPLDENLPPNQIHVIVDARRVETMPPLKTLSQTKMPTNTDWVFFVNNKDEPVGRFIASLVMQILRMRFRFVTSPEDTHDILRHVDPALRDVNFPTDTSALPILRTLDEQHQV